MGRKGRRKLKGKTSGRHEVVCEPAACLPGPRRRLQIVGVILKEGRKKKKGGETAKRKGALQKLARGNFYMP